MNISLTPELEDLVKNQVDTGLYDSASEVVKEALRVWQKEAIYQQKLQTLRERLAIGEAQANAGDFANYDLTAIKNDILNK